MTQPPPTPTGRVRKQFEEVEQVASSTLERLVASQGFSETLGMMTSNVVAASHVASTSLDQVLRMSRIAGRRDVTRLGEQIARTEDKLEKVLQAVEQLETELADTRAERDALLAEKERGSDEPDESGDSQ